MRSRILSIGLTLLLCTALQAQNARRVVKDMIEIFEQTSLKANYVLSASEGAETFIQQGTFLMQGEKFQLNASGLDVCYDGKTQYVYLHEADEISLSEPTAEELIQTNPILMAKAMMQICDLRLKSKDELYEIEFTPKSDTSEIKSLHIMLRATDKVPIHLRMTSAQGLKTTLELSSHQLHIPTSEGDFVIDTTDHPTAFVNDLR